MSPEFILEVIKESLGPNDRYLYVNGSKVQRVSIDDEGSVMLALSDGTELEFEGGVM